jgi:RNA polymerase sigma factor (sigma-70 family)
VDEAEGLATRFEAQRGPLRAVAYRLLGSLDEAEDAVQEAWLRLNRAGTREPDNLGGWLRTVVTRICLDMLRARRSRREDLVGQPLLDGTSDAARWSPPEEEAELAEEVGRGLLVVLEALDPDERVAFVLHDMFAVPFGEIGPLVERTPATRKKLASRARHKVRGTPAVPAAELARHRRVVSAFLAAARAGDLTAILATLAPDVVRRADPAALPPGVPAEVRGAGEVAKGTAALAHRSRQSELALVDGAVGLLVAPRGRLLMAVAFTVEGDRITAYDVIAEPARLRRLRLAVLG